MTRAKKAKAKAKDTAAPTPARDDGPVHVEDGPVHLHRPDRLTDEEKDAARRAEPADEDSLWRDPGTLDAPVRAPRAHGPVPPPPPMPGRSWVETYVRPAHVYRTIRPAMLPAKKRRAA